MYHQHQQQHQQHQHQQQQYCCPRVKCVVVGDGGAGKTCLLSTYARGVFPTDYVPTVFDNYDTTASVDGAQVYLGLWDTAGQEDYDKLRPLSYPETDVFLVCFSVGNRTSFDNVADKWLPELTAHAPRAPVLLVGTKGDLREDQHFLSHQRLHNERPVARQEAVQAADRLGAVAYIECSALKCANVAQVFEDAIRCVLWPDLFPTNGGPGKKNKKKKNNKKGRSGSSSSSCCREARRNNNGGGPAPNKRKSCAVQ